jgi:hypothetical protein
MTAPATAAPDPNVSLDEVVAELESQLGVAIGQVARARLMLKRKDDVIAYLTEQLAARDAAARVAPDTESNSEGEKTI